ncbi:MAG TPA: hypothetical protein VG872_09905 [Acidimicrobiia bacterium]|jgi:hypothetical protein|nr:hypothetical protein [Acidimicrobiia bacterium]
MERFGEDPVPEQPEQGRATFEEMQEAAHSVIADVDDVAQARALIESLEKGGVPTTSIELVGAETREPGGRAKESELPDREAFSSVSKSTITGGIIGIVSGVVLGLLASLSIPALEPVWGMLLGAVFGAAIGGAAGGMSVAKYGSRAWTESFEVEEEQPLQVAVHNRSAEVVAKAEELMSTQLSAGDVRRLG